MKNQTELLSHPSYNPNRLLDRVLTLLSLKNDAALARVLGVAPPVLSKVRHHRLPLPAGLMIQIHDVTRLSLDEIRCLLGVRTRSAMFVPIGCGHPAGAAPTPAARPANGGCMQIEH